MGYKKQKNSHKRNGFYFWYEGNRIPSINSHTLIAVEILLNAAPRRLRAMYNEGIMVRGVGNKKNTLVQGE